MTNALVEPGDAPHDIDNVMDALSTVSSLTDIGTFSQNCGRCVIHNNQTHLREYDIT